MKSSFKQWKQLVLIGMLLWVLIILALFTYFMDLHMDELHASVSLSYFETRRLNPIQGNNRVIMGSVQDPPVSDANSRNDIIFYNQDLNKQAADTLNIDNWSSFDNTVKSMWQRGGQMKRTSNEDNTLAAGQQQSESLINKHMEKILPGEEGTDENQIQLKWRKNSRRGNSMRRKEKELGMGDDLEEYYFMQSKSVISKLWKGNVSSKMLNPRLQKAMKDYMNANKHHVYFSGKRSSKKLSREKLFCEMKNQLKVRTLDGTETPFSTLGWEKHVPKVSIDKLYPSGFRSCAVVTSAGAMLNSSLGKEIDSHEAVLRFNAAPLEGYQKDVGNKTTIRIINSQILANPNYRFNTSTLYKDVTLVAWDPAPYSVNLHKWYKNPDYNLFTPYVEYRRKHPAQPFYILHPKFIWQLWDLIQGNTLETIQPNPPSSGFIGILMMMSLCDEVHVYEYIPSLRQTDLCHYHERYYDAACTLGAYHPLLYEKLLVQRINKGMDVDVQKKGKVILPGFSAIKCDE
ncbi:beta-galactoside alpha-2,6-sialyltransferase 2-like isoform X1 [Acipenser ruthenus]|uniref:beta-galactoside alpha-2,6-sialyltransferase 2-like isoform X1 n=1 Tax=Acipenser ruthenus TaxID=7906 RepID=UPI00145BF484|nr:beta-galactoside alpha-2,6-sialyltransferase 2-like isoform X1 [Acipenser ruthenus]